MKMMKRISALFLVLAMVSAIAVTGVVAAEYTELSVDDFSLQIRAENGTLTVALVCAKDVSGFGAASGIMNIKDKDGNDASSHFTLTTISQGVLNDLTGNVLDRKWGASANDYTNGDTMEAGTWVIYTYAINDTLTDGEYVFEMTFGSDCGNILFSPYAIAKNSVSGTYVTEVSYTAQLSTLSSVAAKGGTVEVYVGGSHTVDGFYNAAEIILEYDYTMLSVKSVVSKAHSQKELKYTDEGGVLKIEEFGEDKNFSTSNYTITFTAIEMGEASVTLTSAKFVHKDNANKSDLIPATLDNKTVNITISQKTYPVTLPDGNITGNSTAVAGEDYTFTASEYKNYAYTVTVKVNGTQIADNKVTDNGDGTYTIDGSAVTGNIEITYTRNGRSYDVFWEGNGAEFVVTKPTTATYGKAFNFTLPDDKTATDAEDGFYYTLEVSINGTKYTDYDVEVGTRNYTIPGTDITGAIVITVTKTETSIETFTVTTDGNAAGDATVHQSPVGKLGEASITLDPESGYEYKVTATMGGQAVTVTCNNNTYTVTNVVGKVVFTVNKSLITTGVEVQQYVTLSGTSMFLVTYDITLESGKVPTYNGNVMFFSDNYAAYCWLVIADTLTVEEAKAMISAEAGTATNVNYGMDINSTGIIDAADAQFVWNMYGAEYSDFTTATMAQFLAADQHQDMKLDVNDALAIVTAILQNTAQ